jgi:hypothetical protein
MHSTLHVLAAASVLAVAACSSVQPEASPMQRPGEMSKWSNGLQVPPNAADRPPPVAKSTGRS